MLAIAALRLGSYGASAPLAMTTSGVRTNDFACVAGVEGVRRAIATQLDSKLIKNASAMGYRNVRSAEAFPDMLGEGGEWSS